MRIVLPFPPSVNRIWRTFNGRVILSKEGRAFREKAAFMARQQGAQPVDGPVHVAVTAYRPRKIGDLDNTLKATLDALRGIAFHDDSQIVGISAWRSDDKENPRIEVVIMEPASDETEAA